MRKATLFIITALMACLTAATAQATLLGHDGLRTANGDCSLPDLDHIPFDRSYLPDGDHWEGIMERVQTRVHDALDHNFAWDGIRVPDDLGSRIDAICDRFQDREWFPDVTALKGDILQKVREMLTDRACDVTWRRDGFSGEPLAQTPEPASWLLIGSGLAGLIAVKRKR